MTSLQINGTDTETQKQTSRGMDEWLRWGVLLALAGMVSYFTTKNEIGRIDQRENGHFEEVIRGLRELREDVREIRNTQTAPKVGRGEGMQ